MASATAAGSSWGTNTPLMPSRICSTDPLSAVAMTGSLGAAGTALGGLGPVGLAVGAALAGVTLGIKQAAEASLQLAETAGRLQDFAETTGFTIAQLQALEHAGAKVGVSSQSMSTALERFSVAMDDVKQAMGLDYR